MKININYFESVQEKKSKCINEGLYTIYKKRKKKDEFEKKSHTVPLVLAIFSQFFLGISVKVLIIIVIKTGFFCSGLFTRTSSHFLINRPSRPPKMHSEIKEISRISTNNNKTKNVKHFNNDSCIDFRKTF